MQSGIHLLEDVGLDIGVFMNKVEELLTFLLGRLFDDVGDLGRLESPQRSENTTETSTVEMSDQRLERCSVRDVEIRRGMSPDMSPSRVDPAQTPTIDLTAEYDVVRANKPRKSNLDKAMLENIRCEHDLIVLT